MKKPMTPSRAGALVWMMLIASLLTGCALLKRRVLVLPADRHISYLEAGQTYTATNATYLVPPVLMQEMLRVFSRLQTNK